MAVKANWQNGEQFNASDANAVAEAVNAAYVKPTGGVPITDLTASVQVSLGKADTAVQSVNAASITDSTTTGRAVITAVDAAAARTTLGVSYGTTAGTVVQGNDSRLSPSSTSITDSTATGRSLITAVDPAAARSAIGVSYGSTGGTVAQGNDSRIVGAEQTANKGVANGYASLDGGGKVPVSQLPSSIMEYQGTYNASTNSPSLANGTGNTGDVYRVTVAGTQNFGAGNISFEVGDYVIYNGSVWEKSDTTDAVSTVAGLTGDVTASSLRGAIATGTPSSTTWLRGDGAWATLPASGITRSVQTITTPTTLGAAANTDYVYFLSRVAQVGEPFVGSNATLLHLDGSNGSTTFTCVAPTPKTWSVAGGSPTISTSQSMFGGASLSIPSGGSRISATSSSFAFGANDFTIEFWVRPNNLTGDQFLISSTGDQWVIGFQGGAGTAFFSEAGGAAISSGNPGYALSPNTWSHIAVARTGNTLRIFVNGQLGGNATRTNYTQSPTATTIFIGGGSSGGTFTGFIDEVRITNACRYTAAFTPPTEPFSEAPFSAATTGTPTLPTAVGNTNQYTLKNTTQSAIICGTTSSQAISGDELDPFYSSTIALVKAEGSNNSTTVTDNSFAPPTWAVSGTAKISTARSKFGSSSLYFDGTTNCYVSSGPDADFALGTGNFTVECFVYITSWSSTINGIVQLAAGGPFSAEGNSVAFGAYQSGGGWALYANNNFYRGGAVSATNTWHHCAAVRNSGTTKLYINGTEVLSVADSVNYTGTYCGLGALYSAASIHTHQGYIDELRITKGVARYVSNFVPPTAAFSMSVQPSLTIAPGSAVSLISDNAGWHSV